MQTFVTQEDFYLFSGPEGDEALPADVASCYEILDKARRTPNWNFEVRFIPNKCWGRKSMPGYLDCTDWQGPYDTCEEAHKAVREQFDEDDDEENDDEE